MSVGIIGLGIMGGAYARNLIKAGESVIGVDPDPQAREALEMAGGRAEARPGPWLAECDLVVLALISPQVLHDVAAELAGLLQPGQIVLETGTFALDDKMAARGAIAPSGAILLDCPVSGTGAQADKADLVMMASGPEDALETVRPLISHFTRVLIAVGEYGAGTKLKFVANHAVALHNAAAAETLSYAVAMGLESGPVYQMLSGGAGQSRMSDLRMPLMISQSYEPPTASMKMFKKDLAVIGDDIAKLGLDLPLYSAVRALYDDAFGFLPESHDTAAVYEVYRRRNAGG